MKFHKKLDVVLPPINTSLKRFKFLATPERRVEAAPKPACIRKSTQGVLHRRNKVSSHVF